MTDKERKQLMITGALFLVFIVAWANTFIFLKKRSAPAPAAPLPIAQGTMVIPPSAAPLQSPPAEAQASLKWARDPFSGKAYSASGAKSAPVLKLVGITWDGISPMAIINNKVVSAGDTVGGCMVQEIREDCVVLNDGTRNFELRLGQ